MKKFDVNIKAFISALSVIGILMILCYVLTFVLPGGEYTRILDTNGNEIIDTTIGFQYTESGMPFYKFILSPFLVLTMSGSATLIAIIIFLLVVGGIFKCLEECKIMTYFLDKITAKYANNRYKLLAIISLFFMLLGTLMGSYEEIIPLVPICVAITTSLGFDNFTGLAISILAGCCGFATGITNPFTIGIAHSIAGISMFSGAWYRAIIFVVIYILMIFFTIKNAKRVERPVQINNSFLRKERLEKATKAFVITMAIGLACVIASCVIKELQDYTMIIMALMFLVGGILSCVIAKVKFKDFISYFVSGLKQIIPAILMILMASSIKYILVEGKILDTILYYLINMIDGMPKFAIVLFIYVIFLIMELFISSGSAKAFLLIPLVLPICQVFGISSRLAVLAFAFGDGFSNVLYPTNAGLLIGLSLADCSITDWFKYSWKFFAINLVVTCLFLLIGLQIGY